MNDQGSETAEKENEKSLANKLKDMEIHDINDRIQDCSSEKNSLRCKKRQPDNLMSLEDKSVNKTSTLSEKLKLKKNTQRFWR